MKTTEQVMASLFAELKQDARSPEGREVLEMMQHNWDIVRKHRDRLHLTILLAEEELRIEDEKFATAFDDLTG
ncbi:hypothetical protein [Tunturiibacter gelidoferens]|uniref:Uncharacterized protein n=1 Tax=Tunturiibacter gelidiferens TaxID=3069689 RepID=A0A9X0QKJ2_9BACT|nr:hypothetical protein [Edaphobacter lichenicola]MBB5331889.1 hypothetical protein [Edaphobacter lichenicola]